MLITRAREICQKVDWWRKYDYWAPLLDFWERVDEKIWRRWRIASISQQNARTAVRQGDFRLAKMYAIHGLQNLYDISDRRLYLDLCSRLQSAIAEGEGCLNVAAALGNWVIQESLFMGHYLRAVGMGHNLGNQLLIAGKNDEAIKTLESAHELSEAWWHIRDMSYFQVALLERLARAYFNAGDEKKAQHYLELFGIHARNIREKVLYHLCKGDAALRAANYEKAQQEFHAVLEWVPNDGSSDFKDSFGNIWNAYLSLGIACLRTGSPERALSYFEAARAHGEKLEGFLNAERRGHYLLLVAEARIQKNELESARAALIEVEKLSQQVDSPRLRVHQLFINALLHEQQNDLTAAEDDLEKALQICYESGFDDEERQFEAIQKAIFN
jgi:tetratricopeptide (TPR) repeat protein